VEQEIVLWNTKNLGYLTVNTAAQLVQCKIPKGAKSFEAGRLGKIEVRGTEVILGAPMIFDKTNVDQFDF
jgi:rhamnose transport system substrate-binding protein